MARSAFSWGERKRPHNSTATLLYHILQCFFAANVARASLRSLRWSCIHALTVRWVRLPSCARRFEQPSTTALSGARLDLC